MDHGTKICIANGFPLHLTFSIPYTYTQCVDSRRQYPVFDICEKTYQIGFSVVRYFVALAVTLNFFF